MKTTSSPSVISACFRNVPGWISRPSPVPIRNALSLAIVIRVGLGKREGTREVAESRRQGWVEGRHKEDQWPCCPGTQTKRRPHRKDPGEETPRPLLSSLLPVSCQSSPMAKPNQKPKGKETGIEILSGQPPRAANRIQKQGRGSREASGRQMEQVHN